MSIRKLTAGEIECRVAQSRKYESKTQVVLLLYKDARVDQRILDELYGPTNWQRKHELIGDRLYCTISVWDADKGMWVEKQDVGTESYTEKEKGQASDSFKRAAFNWGIGRELYTAPRIVFYIDNSLVNEKGQPKCSFDVAHINYKGDSISELVIIDNNYSVVFDMSGYMDGKSVMHPKHEKWNGMIDAIASGKCTIEDCKRRYLLTERVEDMVKDILIKKAQ